MVVSKDKQSSDDQRNLVKSQLDGFTTKKELLAKRIAFIENEISQKKKEAGLLWGCFKQFECFVSLIYVTQLFIYKPFTLFAHLCINAVFFKLLFMQFLLYIATIYLQYHHSSAYLFAIVLVVFIYQVKVLMLVNKYLFMCVDEYLWTQHFNQMARKWYLPGFQSVL